MEFVKSEFEGKNKCFHVSTTICPSKNFEMEIMFIDRGSPGFLRRKLDTRLKILSLDLDGNFTFTQNKLRGGRVPTQKSIFRRKRKHF